MEEAEPNKAVEGTRLARPEIRKSHRFRSSSAASLTLIVRSNEMRTLRFILIATFLIDSEIAAQNQALGIAENRDSNFTDPVQNDVFDLLSNTIFSSINIDNLSLVDALELIQSGAPRIYSGTIPPSRQGVSFIVQHPIPTTRISFTCENISLGLALEEICRQSGMLWTNKGKIFLAPGRKFTNRNSPFPGEIRSTGTEQGATGQPATRSESK